MLPAVFQTLQTPAVLAIVGGGSPIRIFRHGAAPQDTEKPYVTWFEVAGQPYDQLSGTPCGDCDSVQIDCWSMSDAQVEQLAAAVRDAVDVAGIANRIVVNLRDPDTKLYRIGLEADFINSR
ncbi:DUF3168 domain-containing protein [Achromobacter ruhlandii]|uniref:Uncharacterized protein n=1 Tax=Achromobacter ruhlandii TaxID=72557 RepID=A0A2M9GQ04_9BURK|nr:DUF3168 domain-containing protein [Achromobacter ruhlandii]PJM66655.1 DUF3168 domain-containing protein [Achromobacter ruhlandii]CAB3925013.1 hypothetical protein LMG3328_05748 [Achromobacter ruhlandii]